MLSPYLLIDGGKQSPVLKLAFRATLGRLGELRARGPRHFTSLHFRFGFVPRVISMKRDGRGLSQPPLTPQGGTSF